MRLKKAEIGKLLAVIAAAFPTRFSVDELKGDVWHELLGDLDYDVAQIAVKKHIFSSIHPPTIAEVRKEAVKIMFPQRKSAAEAWEEVNSALDRYGYYAQAEGMASLSPETARAVRAIGFAKMCLSENLSVERGQFIRIYEQFEAERHGQELLPDKVRLQIEAVANSLSWRRLADGS
jgi:hypothetical protein